MNKKIVLIIILVIAIALSYSYMLNKHNNKTLKPSAENLINETNFAIFRDYAIEDLLNFGSSDLNNILRIKYNIFHIYK